MANRKPVSNDVNLMPRVKQVRNIVKFAYLVITFEVTK